MRRLSICHVLEAAAGGSGLQVRRLAMAQAAAGHAVTVVLSDRRCDADFPAQTAALAAAGCEVVLEPMGRLPELADFGVVRRLRALLAAREVTVVHTHCAKAGLVGRLAVRPGGGTVCFHTPHSWYLHGLKGMRLATAIRLERYLAKRSDGIICISEEEAATARKLRLAPASKVSVVGNGLPDDFGESLLGRVEAREELGVPADAVVIGAFARLAVRKGLERLVRTLAELPEEVVAVLVGEGAEATRLRALAGELGVAERTYFCGYRTGSGRLVRALDAALLPSAWEGRSLFALEALAAGVPLVLAATPGNRFAEEYGARLVAPEDDAAWVAATQAALADGPQAPAVVASIGSQAASICGIYCRRHEAGCREMQYSGTETQASTSGS